MPICLVPARSGSKRIPDKNILPVRGKPMMHWPLIAAVESGLFDTVLVSTDSERYAEIAERVAGVKAFMRREVTATDTAPLEAVLAEAMQRYKGDLWCMLLPTAIWVTVGMLHASCAASNGNGVVSVTADKENAHRALTISRDGGVVPLSRRGIRLRTQDCGRTYHDAGGFYWLNRCTFMRRWVVCGREILEQGPWPFVVGNAIDIDTPEDLREALNA